VAARFHTYGQSGRPRPRQVLKTSMERMRRPTRIEGQNAQSKAPTTDELVRPAQASEDSDQTQAMSRAPSDTTEVTATGRVVGLRPQRPRRNYTWLNPSQPPPPATRAGEGAPLPEEGQRPAPDPLAHLPPGERPGIVRVREVRRDYEYHYEYIYEEVVPSQAPRDPAAAPQLLPAPAPAAPQLLAPAPAVPVEAKIISERPLPRPQPQAVVATEARVVATAAPAFAAAEVALRPSLAPSLASRAGPAAVIAMGVVLAGLAAAFFFSARMNASQGAGLAAKPPAAVEAPTAPPVTPPSPGAPAAPAVTVTSSVVSAATPDTVASAAASASAAKPNKRKKPATPTPPQH
jgi:hypothetical protein